MICSKQSSLKKGVNIWQVVNENEQLPSYLAKICDVLYYYFEGRSAVWAGNWSRQLVVYQLYGVQK